MKIIITNLFLLLFLNSYSQPQITIEDLKSVIGNWEGEITYLDYQTNNPFTMPANLIVMEGKTEYCLVLNNLYPNEPKANNSDKIKVTKKGRKLNGYLVTKREELDNGHVKIQTEHNGKDDNKKALIRYTYQIGENFFLIRKEVQFEEMGGWIKRSEFSYKRKK